MEVGTAEPIKKKKKKLRKRSELSRLSGFGNDDGSNDNHGGGGGGNGGDNKPKKKDSENTNPEPTNKSRILMIFLLAVVIMTFGGLIGAYVVLSTNQALEWKPLTNLPIQVWISTAIILASSITYHIAKTALLKDQNERKKKGFFTRLLVKLPFQVQISKATILINKFKVYISKIFPAKDQHAKAKRWFLITTVLGGLFISSQLIVWLELYNRGYYMTGNPYVGFFYILTAVHAIHVLGGIIALGYIILRTWKQTFSEREIEKRKNDATAIGWYWHTMDGLWLLLLFLLAFYK